MINAANIRDREVVNLRDGRKLGVVTDVEIDFEEGRITSIIIPGPGRFINFFSKEKEIVIPWNQIKKVGVDVILVDTDNDMGFKDNDE
ncbi:PRC-barrel domain protein [Oxobacter pfennigii]|uniref:PRC-barrel domain protein n=1 Tax=Oxobacter pfennigii TaxID=36849 RepID=A0A0P9AF93_9CLOT|nr:YlmC/YmxH family sporulation protein [Oxobacter pfennigii]KPU44028.1 PRC-barrel domain protein [Oxobacter pfennigii]